VVPERVLKRVDGIFAVAQLPADAAVPDWAHKSAFYTCSRTLDELSIVCLESNLPATQEGVHIERGWACLMLQGPFEFSLTGVLLSVLEPLAFAQVSVFAISTFNTDYVLVKVESLARAAAALKAAGHRLLL
jgi:uncharacterized protein